MVLICGYIVDCGSFCEVNPMAEGQKPAQEGGTKDLADRVSDAVKSGEDITGFHDEIDGLSNDEKLAFMKDLGTSTWQPSFDANLKANDSIFVDPAIEKETGTVLDIDLVIYSKEGQVKTRKDLYTPNEAGKEYDKRQEVAAIASPYRQLLALMNSPFQKTPVSGPEESAANATYVKGLLEKHASAHPDKEAIFAAFEKPRLQDKSVEFDYLDYFNDNTQTPDEVQQKIDEYQKTQRSVL